MHQRTQLQENRYYQRMTTSLQDKLRVVHFIPQGGSILDFGAGNELLAKDIVQKGYHYIAVDKATLPTDLQDDTALLVYLRNKYENQLDVVYLSSVIHEIYSDNYKKTHSETEALQIVQHIVFESLGNLLKKGGKLIIRDWACQTPEFTSVEIYIRKEQTQYVLNYFNVYQEKFIGKQSLEYSFTFENQLKIIGNYYDVREFIFHLTWGIDAVERELNEIYHGIHLPYYHILSEGFFTLKHYENYFQTDYTEHLDKYIETFQESFLQTKLSYPETKCFLVFEKM